MIPLHLTCFLLCFFLSRTRPFDADRCGFVMGEGAGVLLLETLEHAEKRGATIYAELAGYGASCDAHHITTPAPGGAGLAKAIEAALRCVRKEAQKERLCVKKSPVLCVKEPYVAAGEAV